MEKKNSTLGQLPARGGEGGCHMIGRGKSSLGLSRLCSATFGQLLAFGATFAVLTTSSKFCLSEQLLSKIEV